MKKINKHIEIVRSSTKSLSSMGQTSCSMICEVLEQHYSRVGVTIVNDCSDIESLIATQPDLLFLGLKKLPFEASSQQDSPEMVWLAEYLDDRGVNYTGSTAPAIALDFDKPNAKRVVQSAGLRTSPYFIAKEGQYLSPVALPIEFPLFIKPTQTGGGKGIAADSVVRDFATFQNKVHSIAKNYSSHALVEKYLIGREFSVAILESIHAKGLIAMPVELIAKPNNQGDQIIHDLNTAGSESIVEIHDKNIKADVVEMAIEVFYALGARDYGRIDIRLDAEGIPHFLEANLVPGLNDGYFARACWINQAIDYESMILRIVDLAFARSLSPLIEFAPISSCLSDLTAFAVAV